LFSLFGYLGDEAEDMFNTGLDVASKLVYACSLMVVNFTVFNQVRLSVEPDSLAVSTFNNDLV
jgi:hypothetical protein